VCVCVCVCKIKAQGNVEGFQLTPATRLNFQSTKDILIPLQLFGDNDEEFVELTGEVELFPMGRLTVLLLVGDCAPLNNDDRGPAFRPASNAGNPSNRT